MADTSFIFVGYLVQEPYILSRQFPGVRAATIDRNVPKELDEVRFERVGPTFNFTRFLLSPPDMTKYPGWVLNGYAIEASGIHPEKALDGVTSQTSRYEFARYRERPKDTLIFLGFDVVDEPCHPFSILHFEVLPAEEVKLNTGGLNEYGLLADVEAANRFSEYVLRVNQRLGTIWQVWG